MSTESNPYQTPHANLKEDKKRYGGLPRGLFFIGSLFTFVLSYVLLFFMLSLTSNSTNDATFLVSGYLLSSLINIVLFTILAAYRLKNMGYSAWWGLTMLIPIFNLLTLVRCLIYPEAYYDTQQLDFTGKVIVIILALLVVLPIAIPIIVMSFMNPTG